MKVELINVTPNPVKSVFDAYRICYSKLGYHAIKSKTINEMCDFIRPLMLEGHTSPLEHANLTFYIEGISRACQNQLVRHRTGKFNVQSQRYVSGENFEYITPNIDYIADENERKLAEVHFKSWFESSRMIYGELLKCGVDKEDARAILPNATTCNMIVTFDLNNFRKFLAQRLCVHAQKEIRDLAQEMLKLAREEVPFIGDGVMNCGKICNKCFKL